MVEVNVSALVAQAVVPAAVLGLAALGELLVERSGRINLGLEGMLHVAYGAAAAASVATESMLAGYLAAAAAALLLAALYYVAVEILSVNQVVVGLSLVFLGSGLGVILGNMAGGAAGPAMEMSVARVAAATALAAVSSALYLLLQRSWVGYVVRSLGEDEKAARMLGVDVRVTRAAVLAAQAVLVALAASLFLYGYTSGRWTAGRITGQGWLALGMVILGFWHPLGVALASYLLGLLYSVQSLLPAILPRGAVYAVIADSAPYIAVIVALAAASLVYRRTGYRPPASIWQA
jgi:simple sugar transport system permease protein